MLVGYARVSTQDQKLELQRDALAGAGCEKIFEDKASGVKAARPGLTEAVAFMRSGDTLVIWKLSRLGRSLKQLIEAVQMLQDKGIELRSLHEASAQVGELSDDERIAGAHEGDGFAQPRAGGLDAAGLVLKHLFAAGPLESITLKFQLLVLGGDPCVSDKHNLCISFSFVSLLNYSTGDEALIVERGKETGRGGGAFALGSWSVF